VVVELLSERPDARTMLRAVGLRVTNPRVAVLDALHYHPHSTADTVAVHARGVLGSVSTQAVYDVLNACTETGLVRRIEPAGSAALYETRTGDVGGMGRPVSGAAPSLRGVRCRGGVGRGVQRAPGRRPVHC